MRMPFPTLGLVTLQSAIALWMLFTGNSPITSFLFLAVVGQVALTEGKGAAMTTVITFPVVRARFVRITQTASDPDAPAWSIQRLRLYQPPT